MVSSSDGEPGAKSVNQVSSSDGETGAKSVNLVSKVNLVPESEVPTAIEGFTPDTPGVSKVETVGSVDISIDICAGPAVAETVSSDTVVTSSSSAKVLEQGQGQEQALGQGQGQGQGQDQGQGQGQGQGQVQGQGQGQGRRGSTRYTLETFFQVTIFKLHIHAHIRTTPKT